MVANAEGDSAGRREDRFRQAKDMCLRLLTARARTRAELHQSLLRKGFTEDIADQALGSLDAVGLVDDAAFAEAWVRSRHTYSGLARRALAAELRRKGVDDAVAAEAVAEVDRDAEEERARALVRKKLRGRATRTTRDDDTALIRRLVGSLARKGYPQGLAYRVVREELRAAGRDSDTLDELTAE